MKQIITFLFFLLLLTGSCSNENRVVMSQLAHINSLMEVNPQAAYDSLRKDSSFFFQEGERRVKMKYRLLMAKAQNKLYLQMTSDSLFQEVVDYYDANGTSNERMEAHYLMGCVYRDQKESPKAIQCYEKAVGSADTLDKKCDYVMLSRVCGQMATIYTKQFLFDEAVKAESMYCRYALKVGNMADYIGGKEQLAALYCSLGDTTKTVSQIKECISLYTQNNMRKKAAAAVPLLIHIHLKRLQLEKAHDYMQFFEKYSGLFDDQGNICHGREYYYHVKGQYFLGVNQLDSAKYYFRKLDRFGYHYEANKGLLAISRKQKDLEGTLRYAELCEKEMDDILKNNQTHAVLQVSQMYNFQLMQKTLDEQALAEARMKKNLLLFTLLFVVLASSGICLIRKYRKRLQDKYSELAEHKKLLNKKQSLLENSQKEKEAWNDKYLKAFSELEQSKKELNMLQEEFQKLNEAKKPKLIDDEGIYKRFKKMASWGDRGMAVLADSHWDNLLHVVCSYFPLFLKLIENRGKTLSQSELRVALLTRLHFTNSDMAKLMNTSPASISNAKQAANDKLFGEKNAKTLFYNMQNVSFG